MPDNRIAKRLLEQSNHVNRSARQTLARLEGEYGGLKASTGYSRWLRRKMIGVLKDLPAENALTVRDADGVFVVGELDTAINLADVVIHDPRAYHMMAWHGSLGASEAYLQGFWSTSDLTGLLRLLAQNCDTLVSMDRGLARWSNGFSRLSARFRRNTRAGSKKNIADHYDLSNEFFSLFLDASMMYSSAVYDSPDMSLEQASQAKLKYLCRRLRLESSDHLLEIGTGWGGLAEYAARNYGCQITTTTISQKQHDYAKQRFNQSGQSDRVTLLQQDYRDLTGQYDKIVSVEMIEAVGKEYLDNYFRCCNSLLKPGGRFVIQAIVIPEQRFDIYSRSVDFIQTYIFPGSFLPSVASMQLAAGRTTSLRLVGLEDFTPSYVQTLREWRRRFLTRLDEVRALGFDERFIRMWDFYLCSCEAVIMERAASLVQMEWIKV